MNKLKPLISIIVPNYNHEKFLRQRLESVFNQTYDNFEVILLDDYSTDNSRAILLEYATNPKVSHCVFNEVNTGNTFVQWNKGIQLAQGEFIWIAESDDFCDLNFLEVMTKPLLRDKEVVLVYCQSNRVNEFNQVTGTWFDHTQGLKRGSVFLDNFTMEGSEFIQDFLIYKNVIPNTSAVVLRKSAINIDEHIDVTPEFRYCSDWIFYFKLIVGKKIAFVSEPLNSFRSHHNSAIAKSKLKVLGIIEIELKVRKLLLEYLKKENIQNFDKIKIKNKFIERYYLKYEKAFFLVREGKYIRGYFLLITLLDVFFKRYELRKNLKLKIANLFK